MRHALAILCAIHAVAHVVGFAVSWRLIRSPGQPYGTTIMQGRIDLGDAGIRLYGLFWLAIAIGFIVVAAGIQARSVWWLLALEVLVAISLLFCVLDWPAARFGLIANVLVLGVAFATFRFGSYEMPIRNANLEALWATVPVGNDHVFDPTASEGLPDAAKRYFGHAIASDTTLASAVRLSMRGEIKLGSSWHPFEAEQVTTLNGDFIWAAATSMYGIPVIGSDRLVQGQGSMQWRLLDLVPVVSEAGADITRSALGRLHGELVAWLPSALFGTDVTLLSEDAETLRFRVGGPGDSTEVELKMEGQGQPHSISLLRWGNPGGGEHRYVEFGVIVEEVRRFGGHTIPSQIRAGWFYGTERFDTEGEFFRATIYDAAYK